MTLAGDIDLPVLDMTQDPFSRPTSQAPTPMSNIHFFQQPYDYYFSHIVLFPITQFAYSIYMKIKVLIYNNQMKYAEMYFELVYYNRCS